MYLYIQGGHSKLMSGLTILEVARDSFSLATVPVATTCLMESEQLCVVLVPALTGPSNKFWTEEQKAGVEEVAHAGSVRLLTVPTTVHISLERTVIVGRQP